MLYTIRRGEVTRLRIAVDVEPEVDTFLRKTLDTHSEHHVPDTELWLKNKKNQLSKELSNVISI